MFDFGFWMKNSLLKAMRGDQFIILDGKQPYESQASAGGSSGCPSFAL
jgi:hypothetical protein